VIFFVITIFFVLTILLDYVLVFIILMTINKYINFEYII